MSDSKALFRASAMGHCVWWVCMVAKYRNANQCLAK